MSACAQASIEFLSIAAALMGMFAIIFAGFSGIRSSAFAALDAQGAESFINEVGSAAETLSFLGYGSSRKISAASVSGWVFSRESGGCSLAVNTGAAHEKHFALPSNVECGFTGTFRGHGSFTLRKGGSGSLVLNRNH